MNTVTPVNGRWFGLDEDEGNDILIVRQGGRYKWSIHHIKYPDPPTCWFGRITMAKALEVARRCLREYTPPFE